MKRLLLALMLATPIAVKAQTSLEGFGIETNIAAGKMLRHTKKFTAPMPDLSTSYELNFVQQTSGRKDWHQRRNYPLWGFGIAVTNYGIDSVFGKVISIYPNLEIPIIRGEKIEWTVRAAFGLGYVTKPYQRYPNFDTINNAIGSRVNNYSSFYTDLRYHVNEHLDVQLGANFSHISNAAFRQPNLGINMYGAHIGARYFPVTSKPARIATNPPALKNRWLVQARAGISATELGTADGPLFPVYLASVYASKRYLSKNKAYAGIDYSYHSHIYAFQRNNEINIGEEKANSWRGAVFVGNEFLMGRVGLMFQIGVYFKQAYLPMDKFYQKLGGNVYIIQKETGILKELYASCLLKTHKEQAELVEMGIGVGF
jgi:Lipid A 3-O-deacylase (PagL).